MIDVKELRIVFADKLLITNDVDAAFVKAMWVSYKQGLKDAPTVPEMVVVIERHFNESISLLIQNGRSDVVDFVKAIQEDIIRSLAKEYVPLAVEAEAK